MSHERFHRQICKDEVSIYYATITKMQRGRVDLEELPKGTYLRKDPKLLILKYKLREEEVRLLKVILQNLLRVMR
nr:MAG: hypothetical protein CM15mV30_0510 [uncultured marine virus]